jgi:hypothetical protein
MENTISECNSSYSQLCKTLDNLARVARPINILFIGLFTNTLFVIYHN